MEGRLAGTAGEKKALQWLKTRYHKMGMQPLLHTFTYKLCDSCNTLAGDNLYHYIDHNAESTILISAHYDHLGMGAGRSRSYGKVGIHPGADDNASGVALVLGLAHRRKKWMKKEYNYLFVHYTAHESGLFGSAAFAKYCTEHFKPICLVVNFDMVGRLDPETQVLTVYGTNTLTPSQNAGLTSEYTGLLHTDEPEKILQTDCKPFSEKNITCLSFTTGLHEDYHRISDTPDKINFDGIWIIEKLLEKFLHKWNIQ